MKWYEKASEAVGERVLRALMALRDTPETFDLPSGVVMDQAPDFVDERGRIVNLREGSCRGVSVIYSVAGSVRSGHYHKRDSHLLYVISGRMDYYERPVGSTVKWMESLQVGPGQSIYTVAMVEHLTSFPEDTILVSISPRPRDRESHESDVVRVEWFGDWGR